MRCSLENWYYRVLILMTGNLQNAEIEVDALSIWYISPSSYTNQNFVHIVLILFYVKLYTMGLWTDIYVSLYIAWQHDN